MVGGVEAAGVEAALGAERPRVWIGKGAEGGKVSTIMGVGVAGAMERMRSAAASL